MTSPKTAQLDTSKLDWSSEGSTCSSGWLPLQGPRVLPCREVVELKPGKGDFCFCFILLLFFFMSSLLLALGKWTEVHKTWAPGLANTNGQVTFISMDNENMKIPKQQMMESWDSVFSFPPPTPQHAGHQGQDRVHSRYTLYLWATSSALAQCLGKMIYLTHYPQEQVCLLYQKWATPPFLLSVYSVEKVSVKIQEPAALVWLFRVTAMSGTLGSSS